jgi:8-oxo-dGTP pyrophosphatase MutT (NUDIX family)
LGHGRHLLDSNRGPDLRNQSFRTRSGVDWGITLHSVQRPSATQRIGAYAVVVRDSALLLTRISAIGYPPGWWALPGGGIDQGESPSAALVRELYEETGLTARSIRLVDVHDVHTVAPGRGDQYEDYHGIHLLYAVDVPPDQTPRVVELDGTTDEVRWIGLADLERTGENLALLPVVEHVLARIDQFVIGATGDADVPGAGSGAGIQNRTA